MLGDLSSPPGLRQQTLFRVLAAISFSHLLNDTIQSLVPAIYPIFKASFRLSFAEIGLVAFAQQLTASLLQPLVGLYTDRRPTPYSLVVGMASTLVGLLLLSAAGSLPTLLAAVALMGLGSAVFHPESSRVARMASGGRHGLAQSLFQVGGNVGSSFGPLLAAFLVVPYGQRSIAWCSIVALLALVVLWRIGRWYAERTIATPVSSTQHATCRGRHARAAEARAHRACDPRRADLLEVRLPCEPDQLLHLLPDHEISRIGARGTVRSVHLPRVRRCRHDRSAGRSAIASDASGDLVSILGVLPFTLVLPYADLFWTRALTIVIGLILASAFSAILVYAQELFPDRVGLIAGVFFGFAFGIAGLGAAVLGLSPIARASSSSIECARFCRRLAS